MPLVNKLIIIMKLKFWLLSAFLAFTVSAHAQQQMPQPIPIPLQTYIFDPQHPSIPIHRMPSESSLTAYYVPGQLSFSDGLAPCQLTLTNEADGEVIYSANLTDGVTCVTIPQLPEGTYLIKFETSDSTYCGYLVF